LPVKNETFSYDAVGNRLADAAISGYQYDNTNRLLENSSFTYTYDANGNQTGKIEKATNAHTTYGYDSENRMVQVGLPDGTVSAYKYDAVGRRVEKSTGSTASPALTRYVFDGRDVVAILDGNNNMTATFAHGPAIDEPVARQSAGQGLYYHTDILGSIIAGTDDNGNIVEKLEYGAYGKPTFITGGTSPLVSEQSIVGSLYGFGSRPYDAETTLYFHEARFRDPICGQFMSADPSGFGSGDTDLYTYVFDQPTRWRDPDGAAPAVIPLLSPGVPGFPSGGAFPPHLPPITTPPAPAPPPPNPTNTKPTSWPDEGPEMNWVREHLSDPNDPNSWCKAAKALKKAMQCGSDPASKFRKEVAKQIEKFFCRGRRQ
jgi:RHS repeat-associated protein